MTSKKITRPYTRTPRVKPDFTNVILSDVWVDIKDAAAEFRITVRAMRNWCKRLQIPISRPEGTRLCEINKAYIDALRIKSQHTY